MLLIIKFPGFPIISKKYLCSFVVAFFRCWLNIEVESIEGKVRGQEKNDKDILHRSMQCNLMATK